MVVDFFHAFGVAVQTGLPEPVVVDDKFVDECNGYPCTDGF